MEWNITIDFLIVRWLWKGTSVKQNKFQKAEIMQPCLVLIDSMGWPADSSLTRFFLRGVLSLKNKRLYEWTMNPWLVRRRQMKYTVVDSQEVFITLTRKHSEDSKQSPLSVKCLRLCIELSCMGMSSVWITLGSQTHVRSRLHLPLLFASSLYPLTTSWRSARLYIMSNTKDLGAVREKSCSYQLSCSSCV